MQTLNYILLVLIFSISLPSLQAQSPCSAPGFRQFDFWVGEWKVYAKDKLAGTNKVEIILDSCVVMENWVGQGGSKGKSFNTYFPARDEWEQVWVDNSGSTIHFKGKVKDGNMYMTGKTIGKDGGEVMYKMNYYPDADKGSVRQLWESSKDEGKTWKVLFDGLYKK